MGEPVGIAKVIFDAQTGLIKGAHIFGASAPELIQSVTFAMHERMTMRQFSAVITAFPDFLWILNKLFPPPRPGDRRLATSAAITCPWVSMARPRIGAAASMSSTRSSRAR
ncbi:hypothetical protein [Candidatus Mycobacterium methanotrophicum]|uniref:hypothetical protein n=1 Tax=Candidatus Mycobacterium methanotrophicum TaxID=2943498 RepID=UPI00351588FA